MDLQVDVLEFRVPVENNKTVFVWNIDPGRAVDQIYSALWSVFSAFGPVYLLKVCPNAPLAPPGFYALVKFYSCAQALEAQRRTDGQTLFQNTPVKVRLSSKQTPHFLLNNSPPLSHARCLELASHCLGFNGWTSDVVTIKELTNEEEEEGEEEGGVRRRRLRFGCLVELNFPHHGRTTKGAAVVEDSFTCTGPEVLLQKRCKLMKLVKDKALVQAFSTVLLILLGNSKVMVELKQTSDQLEAEDNQQVLQVNEFSWTEFPHDDDDDDDDDDDEGWPLDLTVS
ncbi:RAD52 motif-containing protein 1 isoform X2 [Sphaeramia orbicularis]|uniref:RAD52 motif-containing protein 1 n=1 Tax=Sphaeramia orbicularis TaxID=375764 RepID=A0A672Z479_9TELE|nr:RAD52 motif-containing protein 1 isoform X2 [Sphaeramia orbicularis]